MQLILSSKVLTIIRQKMTLSEYSLYLTRLIIDQHINLPQVIKANATGVFFEECSSHMRLEEK